MKSSEHAVSDCQGVSSILLIPNTYSRHLCSKVGPFQPGIVDANFEAAAEWAKDMGYTGNFQLAVDDTKITAGVRTYLDGSEWKVAGMHSRVETFGSYEELLSMTEIERKELTKRPIKTQTSMNKGQMSTTRQDKQAHERVRTSMTKGSTTSTRVSSSVATVMTDVSQKYGIMVSIKLLKP
jgi:hypothetical protein